MCHFLTKPKRKKVPLTSGAPLNIREVNLEMSKMVINQKKNRLSFCFHNLIIVIKIEDVMKKLW